MEELNKALRVAFANTFLMYFRAQSFHWNVEGILFGQFHEFFGKLYNEVYSAVDPMAEEMRALDFYAPGSLPEVYTDKTVQDTNDHPAALKVQGMLAELEMMNSAVLVSLNEVFRLASKENQQGLADFIAGRIDAHKKHEWMIRAFSKN